MKTDVIDADLIKYLPTIAQLDYHGMINTTKTKKVFADLTYKDFQVLEFNVKLPVNQYMNWNSVHLCLLIQIKSKTNTASMIDTAMITGNSTDIYQYSDAMLKHMP